jgi:hypothetical protein
MAYDGARGCFTIGSLGDGGFQGRFYDTPNLYDTVRFRIANETDEARTVYVCHENIGGDKGCVEGGVLLDEDGHPLPIVVQISKNFAGEKEEPFYNPQDTPFSELYYPLMLAPGESREITSLQLYQNWGSHMVKQFSSLGAWMDYFHSSTGVTETTCYVPFKFGGLPGVAIADFRAMSQPYFWSGQPQHDNVAGHSFLSYDAGEGWRYLVYQGTNYHSTGPNWMHIGFDYLSADGALKAHVESVELPQVDELRQCVRVRYEALKPVTLSEAGGNLRLLTCASWVQRMRYNHMAATGMAPQRLTFDEDGYAVLGHPLPHENSFAAVYGEPKGSNAFVLRRWETSVSDLGPAVSLWRETSGDTRLLLTVDKDEVTLQPGDFVEFDAVIMPYGVITNADIPERETVAYGSEGPKVVSVARGRKLRDFPAIIEAEEDAAEFTIQGGRDALPVVVTGLSDYRDPRLERKTAAGWQLVSHYRVSPYDGAQTFVCEDGGFGAVFLVNSNAAPQTLRARLGGGAPKPELVQLDAFEPSEAAGDFKKLHHAALIQAPWMDAPIHLRYPETVNTDALDFIDHEREDMPPRVDPGPLATQWKRGEGGSLWFEWNYDNQAMGGRLSPGTDFVDLEFWIENRRPETVPLGLQFCPVLEGTAFDDPQLERTFGYVDGEWVALMNTDRSEGAFEMCHYEVGDAELPPLPKPWGRAAEKLDEGFVAIKSEDGKRIFAIVWPQARNVLTNTHIPCVHADPPPYPAAPGKRLHLRGKVYLIEGSLDDLLARVRREVTPMAKRFD